MNQDVFFKNFELLADAPNGVQKLRELILQLAVMGKLVPQDPNDDPTSVLVEQIKAEKKRLIKEGKIKGSKQLLEISDNEVLFEVPDSWKWVRFDDICSYIQRGKSPKYVEESEFPVIAQKCIQWEGLKIDRAKFIDPLTIGKYEEERFLRTGDLLWNSTGTGTIGRVNVYVHEENTYDKVVADTHVTVVRPLQADSYYVFCWIAGPMVQSNIENIASGSTNQIELATSTVKNHVIPLPPLAEQKRIVSKVNELMALCDKLEARRQKKQEVQSKLNSAALDRMLSAENKEEFEQNWQRICEHFDLLYDNPENVEKLRQAILQLAVQGKLVEQNPEDEPASALIEEIKAEKKKLVKEKKIKEIKVNSTENEDLPFSLPENWIWTMLGNLCIQVSDGPHYSPQYVSKKEGVPFLSARNIRIDGFELDSAKYVSFADHEEFCKRIKPEKGDILYTKGGTTGVAKVNDLDFEFSVWVHVAVLRLAKSFIDPYYLALTLNSPLCYEQSQKFTHGSSNKDLGLTRMINILLPLPPLNEQKRIVEKVEQFMGLCDELESKLRKEREDSEKLLETVVRGLLEGAAAEI